MMLLVMTARRLSTSNRVWFEGQKLFIIELLLDMLKHCRARDPAPLQLGGV